MLDISIHALRKESDDGRKPSAAHCIFQSTLSVRRATMVSDPLPEMSIFQSTLSVRRATTTNSCWPSCATFQSTLSVRRATCATHTPQCSRTFQSTLSVRRATIIADWTMMSREISIHALRKESDFARHMRHLARSHFNPRSP